MKDNVLPNSAELTINSRLHPAHTSQDIIDHITRTVNDGRIKVIIMIFDVHSHLGLFIAEI